jgi:hypothetical protein
MAPRPKVPRGLSMADKGKERETIIVSETLVGRITNYGVVLIAFRRNPITIAATNRTIESYLGFLEK